MHVLGETTHKESAAEGVVGQPFEAKHTKCSPDRRRTSVLMSTFVSRPYIRGQFHSGHLDRM
jgi:hypothetical protein